MKTELIDVSQTRKEIKINIDAADVRVEYDRVSDRYARLATVPGFRPGRAPRSVVRRHYKNEIRGEVLRELLPQAVADALEEYRLNPIGEPDVHLDNTEGLEQIGEQPLALHAVVEVLPEVKLGEYKNLELTRRTRPIREEDIDRVIEATREQSASLLPVEDRGAEVGDTVTVTFRGKYAEGEAERDVEVEDVDVELGGEGVLTEITDNLLGVKADEERQFSITYPADFSSEELAGKTVNYTALVTAVRRTELPEVDDEWAQSIGDGVSTVAELREQIRGRLEEGVRTESEGRLRDQVIRQLVAAHQLEVPETLLENQTQRIMQSTIYEMMQRGYDPRTAPDLDWGPLHEATRARAERELRGSLILEQIADEERIEVTDEEVNAEIERLAEAVRQSPEQVRAALTKQGGERSIADRLRVRRTLDFLVENARVTEGEWRDESEPAASNQADAPSAPAADAQPETGERTAAEESA